MESSSVFGCWVSVKACSRCIRRMWHVRPLTYEDDIRRILHHLLQLLLAFNEGPVLLAAPPPAIL